MYLCGFVALYVGMFVARANKVEGTMSYYEPMRSKEPMRSWHLFKRGIGKGRTRALSDCHLDP